MKPYLLILLTLLFLPAIYSQEVIELLHEDIPEVSYDNAEKQYFSDQWNTTVITNVSIPTLTIYRPSSDKNTGTAVIIAPGGGLYGLSINSEGIDVANYLVSKGVTACVLKYRLVPTGEDGTKEIGELMTKDPDLLFKKVNQVLPYSVQDGLQAISHIRKNADKYGIDNGKIGFMGFSAGGAVTLGVAYNYDEETRPDFLVPVYPWTTAMPVRKAPEDGPPMLIICATDDGLGLAAGAVDLYKSWYDRKLSVGMHMFSKGNHGFGMKMQDLAADHWIDHFYAWAVDEGWIVP